MGVEIIGQVGEQTLSNGSKSIIRLDNSGAVVTASPAEIDALDGNTYIGANLGGTPVTTQAGLSATTPALTLYNPVGSGVNLVLTHVRVMFTASPAAACGIMLAYNEPNATAPATTTLATVTNAKLHGTASPLGQCYRISTLAAAPLMFLALGGTTGASGIGGFQLQQHLEGEVIITPGVAVSIQSTSAGAVLCSFTWKEVSI